MIMYSKGFVVDCSNDEDVRENRRGHKPRVRRVKRGSRRVGLVDAGSAEAVFEELEEVEVEIGRVRYNNRSSRRWPSG